MRRRAHPPGTDDRTGAPERPKAPGSLVPLLLVTTLGAGVAALAAAPGAPSEAPPAEGPGDPAQEPPAEPRNEDAPPAQDGPRDPQEDEDDTFTPSEELSRDRSVSFPVDI